MSKVNIKSLGLGAVSGLMLACALPWPGLWPAAWVGLAPLLYGLTVFDTKRAALCSLAAGVVYYLIILYWLSIFGFAPWIMLSLLQAVFLVGFALVARLVMPARIGWFGYVAVPALWVVMQWARTLGMFGFTWGSLAHTQANMLPVIQIASLGGAWLVDLVLCFYNLCLAETMRRRIARENPSSAFRPMGLAIALMVVVGGWGATSVLRQPRTPTFRAAIVQGNVDQDVVAGKAYLDSTMTTYEVLSRSAKSFSPDFIVWPETTIPTDLPGTAYESRMKTVARDTESTLIAGAYNAVDRNDSRHAANAAYVYSPKGDPLGIYRKVRLLPFGEFVPMRKWLTFIDNYGVRPYDVVPGKSRDIVQAAVGPIGINICFESLFSDVSGAETRDGAQALFVLTNDAWFRRTHAAEQHLMMSRLRAVENRRSLVRAGATGISAIIDPYGRVISSLGIFRQGVVTGTAPLRSDLTPYSRLGDFLPALCGLISLVGLGMTKRKPPAPPLSGG